MVYSKALKLCVWTISEHKEDIENDSVVRENGLSVSMSNSKPNQPPEKGHSTTDVGTITNLMSEDAFNVMTFFWIGHYVWAIPVKVSFNEVSFKTLTLMCLSIKIFMDVILNFKFTQ